MANESWLGVPLYSEFELFCDKIRPAYLGPLIYDAPIVISQVTKDASMYLARYMSATLFSLAKPLGLDFDRTLQYLNSIKTLCRPHERLPQALLGE